MKTISLKPILLIIADTLVNIAVKIAYFIHLLLLECSSLFTIKNAPDIIKILDIIFITVIFSFKNIQDSISVKTILVLSTGVTSLTLPKSSALK